MAHKKAGGSSRNGRDSEGRRLGVKKYGGEVVSPGNIIIRQRGTKVHPGDNVGIGKDHTIFSVAEGKVSSTKHGTAPQCTWRQPDKRNQRHGVSRGEWRAVPLFLYLAVVTDEIS